MCMYPKLSMAIYATVAANGTYTVGTLGNNARVVGCAVSKVVDADDAIIQFKAGVIVFFNMRLTALTGIVNKSKVKWFGTSGHAAENVDTVGIASDGAEGNLPFGTGPYIWSSGDSQDLPLSYTITNVGLGTCTVFYIDGSSSGAEMG